MMSELDTLVAPLPVSSTRDQVSDQNDNDKQSEGAADANDRHVGPIIRDTLELFSNELSGFRL